MDERKRRVPADAVGNLPDNQRSDVAQPQQQPPMEQPPQEQTPMQMPMQEAQGMQGKSILNDGRKMSVMADRMEQNLKGIKDGNVGGVIDKEALHKATVTLHKYKQGKANLERRIIDNEQWYKMRHWECMRDKQSQVQPASAWLFNCLANKLADAMDSFPSPNVLPREEGDKAEAQKLSSILPVILEQCDFEQVYNDVWTYKLRSGTGVYGIFWDGKKNNIGDISIQKVDLINLFWQPGITDIQDSRNLFHVQLQDNESLIEQYPQLEGKLASSTIQLSEYIFDDSVDTSEKSAVIDWYYKKYSGGKTVLHYCKYVNDEVLFATENEPDFAEKGWYEHGEYPFVFDVLYPVEGTPAGFGYVDVGKDCQSYIDRGNAAIMQSMLANSRPRYFINSSGSVNEEEFSDMTKTLVHVDGSLGQDSIAPVMSSNLESIYVSILEAKVEELKETTGNRDVSSGGTSAGVTSASGIAAMQEASAKISRKDSKAAYRAYRRMILQVIELIRQFYDLPRCFRIMGESGKHEFVQFSNENIVPQQQDGIFDVQMGYRLPLFDVEVTAQKASIYSQLSQNEMALQFYNAGFFNPEMADQALACLDMMDFSRKEFIIKKISENQTLLQQVQMLQQQLMSMAGVIDNSPIGDGSFTAGLQQQFGMTPTASAPSGGGDMTAPGQTNNPSTMDSDESWVTKKARQQAAERTAPR